MAETRPTLTRYEEEAAFARALRIAAETTGPADDRAAFEARYVAALPRALDEVRALRAEWCL